MSHTGFAWAVHPFFPLTTLRCTFSIYQQSFGGKKGQRGPVRTEELGKYWV